VNSCAGPVEACEEVRGPLFKVLRALRARAYCAQSAVLALPPRRLREPCSLLDVRARDLNEQCALCGEPPGWYCRTVMRGDRRSPPLRWCHWQPAACTGLITSGWQCGPSDFELARRLRALRVMSNAVESKQPPTSGAAQAAPTATLAASLAGDAAARKAAPIASGVLFYFPNALAAVAALSRIGNEQHNPGQPMHWAFDKSTDEADCIVRHLAQSGALDADGVPHSVKVAWRALALLERELLAAHKELEPGKNVRNCTRAPATAAAATAVVTRKLQEGDRVRVLRAPADMPGEGYKNRLVGHVGVIVDVSGGLVEVQGADSRDSQNSWWFGPSDLELVEP
jgi:hypothetical protein